MKIFTNIALPLIIFSWAPLAAWTLSGFLGDSWFMPALIASAAVVGLLINDHQRWAKAD